MKKKSNKSLASDKPLASGRLKDSVCSRLIAVRLFLALCLLAPAASHAEAAKRQTLNFDLDWQLFVGDLPASVFSKAESLQKIPHSRKISLPRAFNGEEAFSLPIHELTDTVVWYYKTFKLPPKAAEGKVFIEFEGVRQGADVYVNGHHAGYHENGVMAFGLDLTPYIYWNGSENLIAVRVDNSWTYRERGGTREYAGAAPGAPAPSGEEQPTQNRSRFQWNDRNFNANYGGIPKHVRQHLTGKVYQTLPLFSHLGTIGTYVYATDIDIAGRKAVIHAESQVRNESGTPVEIRYEATVYDRDGHPVEADGSFGSAPRTLQPGETAILQASAPASGLHFWSWGYGYLYTVKTRLLQDGRVIDETETRTGFRKTRFAEGKVWLNDRVIQLKGYAQRSSNEWPATGMSVPPWLSDYSNGLMVESGANLVRWMHVTPWKQDVESCDRVGLIQAMPAGDSERDVDGRRWEQRVMLMRDAIIYNRNNPSILFYECGNKGVSERHLEEMKQLRDTYDPHGGRAVGSREMLDVDSSEYGGEMLYINKSGKHPMWAMEYSRDEAMRRYADEWTYPYHQNGDGPLYKGEDASAYNLNQDILAVEHVRRWFDYWRERPGTGRRTNAGAVKIVFSDTNTHSRGESNYRTSGVTDAMRIPKESFFAHKVMWSGWVDNEKESTHIIGHWNYAPETVKPVYVVSTAPHVTLLLNGKTLPEGKREYAFLHTFAAVRYEPGTLVAVGCDAAGQVTSSDTLRTADSPAALRMTVKTAPDGFHADGADMALIEVEAVDRYGNRCPTEHRMVTFSTEGPAEYLGGIAGNTPNDRPETPRNYILSESLPLECGVTRVLVRSTRESGTVKVNVRAEGLEGAFAKWKSHAVRQTGGLSSFFAANALKGSLLRGETPSDPSYRDTKTSVGIASADTGANVGNARLSFDDNERSEWTNDGRLQTAWICYRLDSATVVDEACLKLTGWRGRSYPLEIYADTTLVWSGDTPKNLGYAHLRLRPVKASSIRIQLKGKVEESDAFGQITELAAPVDGDLDLYKSKDGYETRNELRIVEIDLLHHLTDLDDDGVPRAKK